MKQLKRRTVSEVWMILQDPKKLARLMVIQEVSQRDLATAVGWASHSYLGRLLRGEVKSLDTRKAVAIAHYLGVGTDDLFLAKSDTDSVRHGQQHSGRAA